MAETKKKTTTGKSAAEKRKAELMQQDAQRRHIISVVLFAFGILVTALTLFGKAEGEELSAWDSIHCFLYGLFGLAAILTGPVLMYIAIMISASRTRATIARSVLQFVLIILLLCAAAQVIFVGSIGDPEAEEATLSDVISYVYDRGVSLSGGGVFGIILGAPLLLFGQAGAIIILVLIAFVIIMLLTNLTLVDFLTAVTKPFRKAGHYAKEKHEQHREESAYLQQEYRALEAEKQQLRAAEREQRKTERQARQLSDEEARARRFASIENVTTKAQQEVTEEDKREAAAKQAEQVNHVEKQKKESEEFRKDLNAFLKGKTGATEKKEPVPVQETFETVKIEENPQESAPYSPDGPFFADDSEEVQPVKPAIEIEQRPSLVSEASTSTPSEPEQASLPEDFPFDVDEGDKIVEAIQDFSREQQENEKKAAENAEKVIATVIRSDENGQQRFEDIVANAEQYKVPPSELLNDVVHERSDEDINAEIRYNAEKLVSTLKSFGVETRFLEAARGPSVTRYELQPAMGVKISKITGLVDDIALNLATAGVRIEAPIPNKAAVGIEVPNKKVDSVPFREMVESREFAETKSKLGAVLGKSISGEVVIADIAKMPHILIAGTTGSGKSVCVNSIIMSILFRSTPEEVRLLMIDPKAVEFMIYNGIPHLLIPVVTDPKKASGALAWAVTEMLSRYKLFSDNNVRDLTGYNALAKTRDDLQVVPQVVIFIDELADLMMASPGEVEDSICRLAQMARAAGMHLVIATQRPSVNVVTGVIKANIPSRIALKVASQVDSRTIIDSAGAEKLLGKGDMLYFPVGMPKPMRVQGCWVSDKEVERVVDFIKNSFILDYDQSVIDEIEKQAELAAQKASKGKPDDDDGGDINVSDEKLDEAIEAVIEAGQASTSFLQRKLKLGYGRAARLIDTMEQLGVVGGYEGAKPRQVIMTKQEWYERKMNKLD